MTDQSYRATYIHRRVFAQTNAIICGYRDRKQAELFNVDHVVLFSSISWHCIVFRKEWGRLCLSVFFLPLVLGMRLLLLCRATRHVLISLLSIDVSKELANGYYKYIIDLAY